MKDLSGDGKVTKGYKYGGKVKLAGGGCVMAGRGG